MDKRKGHLFFFPLVWCKHPFRYFSAEASIPIIIAPRTLVRIKICSSQCRVGVTGIEIILQP